MYGRKTPAKVLDQLVIDEGQDIPPGFYDVAPHLCKGVTIFADPNQAIYEEAHTTIKGMEAQLAPFNPKRILLTVNFRNKKRISDFALHFKSKHFQHPRLAPLSDLGEYPILCQTNNEAEQKNFILQYMLKNRQKTVGVFLSYANQVEAWCRYFIGTMNGVSVQGYVSRDGPTHGVPNFQHSGLYVLTYQSAKGLEFDTVFLPKIETLNPNSNRTMNYMYVGATRAREMLYLLYASNDIPDVIKVAMRDVKERQYTHTTYEKGRAMLDKAMVKTPTVGYVTHGAEQRNGELSRLPLTVNVYLEKVRTELTRDYAERIILIFKGRDNSKDIASFADMSDFIKVHLLGTVQMRAIEVLTKYWEKEVEDE